MQLFKLDRNAKRAAEIVGVLGKYGLAGWLQSVDVDWLHGWLKAPDGKRLSTMTQAERIRVALTELGTTFVKLGQILSTRPDLVGPEIAEELTKLQSDTPADPPATVTATIESELGNKPDELFAHFDAKAFASASIGQVHHARIGDDREVVVKVQHDGISDTVHEDLDILAALAELADRHSPEMRAYRPIQTVKEFRGMLLAELDFSRERRNLEAFRRSFHDDETVHIPMPFVDRSAKRVLTMEWMNGVSVADADKLRAEGKDLSEFARRGVIMYLNMVFRDGLYHADPHPGNLLYMDGGVVGLLDCGMVGRVDEQLRADLEDMLLAIEGKDARQLTDTIVRLGSVQAGFDRSQLQGDISEFLLDYGTQSIRDFDLSGALNRITEIVRDHKIVLPANCSMLIKTLVMLEGTAKKLSPDFSLGEVIEPYATEIIARRFAPQRLMRRLRATYRDWDRLLETLPRSLTDALDRVDQGRFSIHLEHQRLDTVANRLVLGLLSSALLLGSTLLWALNAPPLVADVSVFGAIGYAISLYLAYRLWRAIKKSGDLAQRD